MTIGLTPGELVLRPPMTADFEQLMARLLAYPGIAVVSAIDVDTLDYLPTLTFGITGGRLVRNGMPAGGWVCSLNLTLFTNQAEDHDAAVADTVFQNVYDMEQNGVPGLGAVNSVSVDSMFDRTAVIDVVGKNIVQQSASFTVIITPLSL